MARSRKTYTPEFKARIVIEVLKEEKTVGEIAAENDISPTIISKWKKEFLAHPERVFDEKRREREEKQKECTYEKERDQMLKTIGTLTLERDYLRRSCKHFGIEVEPDQFCENQQRY